MRKNKFEYLWIVQQHTGYGWEDVTADEKWLDAKRTAKEYRDNQNYPVRVIQRRVPNDEV